jgi:hypothetical protein
MAGPPTCHSDERWMMQQARNVQMWREGQGIEVRFPLRDRDAKFAPPEQAQWTC